ncbi:glycine cleavage system protein T [Oceanicola sp. 22II-s10i]|uniref:glycine cleavage system aminomethyltransferase GcvT n=1 Tax=Oceanicola sp. 22II-s10i TaxID=1317116 RepID=UPI000B52920B|nr:glycine cleavage system aminomethyltransferase GcvT [Oceanicola sp. 22II-s10i]OWU86333.1 glycine cleavage system protein T [Oceanicola sp. 22II-s10i]
MADLLKTPLYDLHVSLGAKMVEFAGYAMPVQYAAGVMKEHLHTRAAAGLFDVSHMGQVILKADSFETVALALEGLIPVSVAALQPGRQRYGFFTDETGGILDDLMFANRGDHVFMVVNAACKAEDLAHMRAHLGGVEITEITDRALIALQGPEAEAALAALAPAVADMKFMDVLTTEMLGAEVWISRSGYTGEDGFEISIPEASAEEIARALLADDRVLPIGLGARDSLRLEAGLCLYGHDIDTSTSPVEAGLNWAIQKVRRTGGERAGGFPGADRILSELADGPSRLRVGLLPDGRAPMREGTALFADETAAEPVGHVTSGAFGPTLQAPMSMGYLPVTLGTPGTTVYGEVRGKRLPATVAELPFVPARFKR